MLTTKAKADVLFDTPLPVAALASPVCNAVTSTHVMLGATFEFTSSPSSVSAAEAPPFLHLRALWVLTLLGAVVATVAPSVRLAIAAFLCAALASPVGNAVMGGSRSTLWTPVTFATPTPAVGDAKTGNASGHGTLDTSWCLASWNHHHLLLVAIAIAKVSSLAILHHIKGPDGAT